LADPGKGKFSVPESLPSIARGKKEGIYHLSFTKTSLPNKFGDYIK
jgi:hypothetical protein